MKIVEVVFDQKFLKNVVGIAEKYGAEDIWISSLGQDGRHFSRLIIPAEQTQPVLDSLQAVLGENLSWKISVIHSEAILPKKTEEKNEDDIKSGSISTTREALYNSIEKNAKLDTAFLLLVFLSTIVVSIGLIEDNVAVVIGAMVIAPLLGPNLALALGAALGDLNLMWEAAKTTLAGMGVALVLSIGIGLVSPVNFESQELLARTNVGLDSVALALASGAAAVISLTTGLPSVLVGVMVSVALLPPTATLGLMIGAHKTNLAIGAGLLLAINIVSVNLAAKISFLFRGIKPRTWLEKKKALQSMSLYIVIWVLSLMFLLLAVYVKDKMNY